MKMSKNNRSRIKAIRARCLECSESALEIKHCPFNGMDHEKCPLYPFRFGMTIQAVVKKYGEKLVRGGDAFPCRLEISGMERYPGKAIRAKCLDCTDGSSGEVKRCTCDGHDLVLCPLYGFRFGRGPRDDDPQSRPKLARIPGVEYVK